MSRRRVHTFRHMTWAVPEFRRLCVLLLFVVFADAGQRTWAQGVATSTGREFYAMVMRYGGSNDTTVHYIRAFLSSTCAATARVEVNGIGFSTTVALVPNVVSTVTIPALTEDTSAMRATMQSIHILADTPIAAYVIYHKQFSTDSYLALPVSALGTEYIAACYQSSVQPFNPKTAPEIGIVGTVDGTLVTIVPTATLSDGTPRGRAFTITLNRGESYLVYGKASDANCDLTGTTIAATHPVAVFSGHERTEVPHDSAQSRDCLVEQLPPIASLGTSFIPIPFVPRSKPRWDYFRIIAPFDSTEVLVNGTSVALLSGGSFFETTSSLPMTITTSRPVLVAQYALSATDSAGKYRASIGNTLWDPAMMLVVPTQQFMRDYLVTNSIDPAFSQSYVTLVVPDSAVPSVRVDGVLPGAVFLPVSGTGYSFAYVPTSQGSHALTASAPFGVSVYGFGSADSYANVGGAAFRVLNGLLVSSGDLDFGGVPTDTCRDSSVVFHNAGAAPIDVWKITFDSGAAEFTVIGGSPPFRIEPGDSHIVRIRFCPSVPGKRGPIALHVVSDAIERPLMTIRGVGTAPGVGTDIGELDMLVVRVASSRDSTVDLRNTGTQDLRVDSLACGAEPSDFAVIAPLAAFSLPPGASVPVQIRFTPSAEVLRYSALEVWSNGATVAQMPMRGRGALPHLSAVPETLDLGRVRLGRWKDSLLTLTASGYLPTAIAASTLSGGDVGDFSISGVPPKVTLQPGESIPVSVRFSPSAPGIRRTSLFVASDAAESTLVAEIRGNARGSVVRTINATDTLRGRVGDTIHVPLRLLLPIDSALADGYQMTLTFDSTMLYAIGCRPGSGWSAAQFPPTVFPGPGVARVTASSGGTVMLFGTGTLATVDMLVLLGTNLSTPLSITAAQYHTVDGDTDAVLVDSHDGMFAVDSLCGGESSLVSLGGPMAVRDIVPNPATSLVVVKIDVGYAAPVILALFDRLGRTVSRINDGPLSVGRHEFVIDGAALPSGAYVVEMICGRYRSVHPLIITH